jgi:tRNA (uracil-5-)-methyltransferase TRM9
MTAIGVTPDIVLDIFLMTFILECSRLTIMVTNRDVFNSIAESWYRLRHWSRFKPELLEMADRWRQGRLLNIGCAHGPDFLQFCQNYELWGVDFSEHMIEQAQKYAAKFKFTAQLIVADAVCLPFPDGVFDCAIALAAYHHIKGESQRMEAFRELHRVLKPGGEVFLTVWNRWQPRFWFSGREANMEWKTKGTIYYRYHYLYTYYELRMILEAAGFKVIRMFPEHAYRFPIGIFSRNICVLGRSV